MLYASAVNFYNLMYTFVNIDGICLHSMGNLLIVIFFEIQRFKQVVATRLATS